MTLKFECGCVMTPFVGEDEELRIGVGCCPEHQSNGTCVLSGQVLEGIDDAMPVGVRTSFHDAPIN